MTENQVALGRNAFATSRGVIGDQDPGDYGESQEGPIGEWRKKKG